MSVRSGGEPPLTRVCRRTAASRYLDALRGRRYRNSPGPCRDGPRVRRHGRPLPRRRWPGSSGWRDGAGAAADRSARSGRGWWRSTSAPTSAATRWRWRAGWARSGRVYALEPEARCFELLSRAVGGGRCAAGRGAPGGGRPSTRAGRRSIVATVDQRRSPRRPGRRRAPDGHGAGGQPRRSARRRAARRLSQAHRPGRRGVGAAGPAPDAGAPPAATRAVRRLAARCSNAPGSALRHSSSPLRGRRVRAAPAAATTARTEPVHPDVAWSLARAAGRLLVYFRHEA